MAGNVLPLTTQIGERIDRIMIEQGDIVPPADRSAIDPGQRDPAAVMWIGIIRSPQERPSILAISVL
jgi:hypothetical protein